MRKNYDVIIIGGGPAGGQSAKVLAQKGHSVLLVERFNSFLENSFSSAGMTLGPLEEFNLPESVVGSYWKNLDIQCTKDQYHWKSEDDTVKGVVLDFGKLRQYLADEAEKNGAEILLGHKYTHKEYEGDTVIAHFKNNTTKEKVSFSAKIIVDATGPLRKVMYDSITEQPNMEVAVGIEYLIKVKDEVYNKYKDKLVFFLGHKWAIHGYSWVFPMKQNILKVGSGKIYVKEESQQLNDSIKSLTEMVIKDYLKTDDFELLDVHGGTLRYSTSIKDTFYKDKIIAVGDGISAVNPLGGEGIRFAMRSANMACDYVDKYLNNQKVNFSEYRKTWRGKYLFNWLLCEVGARRMYSNYSDEKIEKRIQQYHNVANIDTLINTLFEFKFNKIFYRVSLLVLHIVKEKFSGFFGKRK